MASSIYKLQRYKFQKLPAGETTLIFYYHDSESDESGELCRKKVIVDRSSCDNVGKTYLKYLCPDGRYRFAYFTKSFKLQQTDSSTGEANRLVTDLETSQSSKETISIETVKSLELSTQVTQEQYEQYVWLLQSPRVYLQRDTEELNDEDENWVLVTVTGSPAYNTKKPRQTFTVTVTLPPYNNMIM